MSEKCNSCPSREGCQIDSSECSETQRILGSLNHIHNVVAIMSGKGGVGKSSVTALLAGSMARSGKKVGVLDADITGPSQPKIFGLTKHKLKMTEYGIIPPKSPAGIKIMSINFFLPKEDDPVLWRGPMLAGAVNQFWNEVDWRELDFLLIDLPPGTGDVPITVMQSLPIKGIVIISSPQDLAIMVVKKTIKMAQKMNIPIVGLIENMSYVICDHCQEKMELFGKSQGEEVAKSNGIDFLGSLPWDTKLTAQADQGKIDEYFSMAIETIKDQILVKLS